MNQCGGCVPPPPMLPMNPDPNAPKPDGGGDPFNGMTVRDLMQVMMKAKEGGTVDPAMAAMMQKMMPGVPIPGQQQAPSGNMGNAPPAPAIMDMGQSAGGCPGAMGSMSSMGSMGGMQGMPPPAPPPPMGGMPGGMNNMGGMGCMGQQPGGAPGGCQNSGAPGGLNEQTMSQMMAVMMQQQPPGAPAGGCQAIVAQTQPAQDPAMAAALQALQQTNMNAAAMGITPGIDPGLGAMNSMGAMGGMPGMDGMPGMGSMGSTVPAVDEVAGQAELINQLSTMAAMMMVPGAQQPGVADPNAGGAASALDLAALAASGMDPNTMATLLTLYGLQAVGADGIAGVKKRRFKGGPAEAKPGDWICLSCESLNYCMEKTCFKCEADNTNAERVGMKLGDWICPNCSDLVFSQNRACRKCSTRRPAETLKGGEWICDKCDYIVFWFKKVCSKCNAPRPGEGVAVKVFDELKKERNRQRDVDREAGGREGGGREAGGRSGGKGGGGDRDRDRRR